LVELHEIGAYIGMGVFAPPGIPGDRTAALRKAFSDTMKDPELLSEAKRLDVAIDPDSGENIQKTIARAYGFSGAVRARLRDALEVK
jgi:tripartite-type tricarboxylate transporter receptor subunit TctC